MDVLSSIVTGVALLAIGGAISLVKKYGKKKVAMSKQVTQNTADIQTMKDEYCELKQLLILALGMTVIIGDGMIQSGVNGEVKKAFNEKKQDALKFL